ncbi:MAG: hypothetical protein ACK4GN_05055 [Runella sp.]
MKIGIVGILIGASIWGWYLTNQNTDVTIQAPQPSLSALPRPQAEIVYFEYNPNTSYPENDQLKLRLERRTDGQLYLRDDAWNNTLTTYYALNGSVNRLDARQLTQQPIQPNRWIHLVKYLTEVKNINADSWATSVFNVATGQAKYASVAEVIFWVRDSLQKNLPKLTYTQPLWPNNEAVGDIKIFKQTPAFTLPPDKQYGSESTPVDEPLQNLRKVSWNTSDRKFRLLYTADVEALIRHIRPVQRQGVARFDNRQLDQAADWLANYTSSQIFAIDFEPPNPKETGWQWDYGDPNFRNNLYQLSDRIYKRHKKLFFSWIGEPVTFNLRGKTFRLDGYANDTWSSDKKNIDDWLSVHENPTELQNIQLPSPHILMIGFGYTSTTVNTGDTHDQPANVWKAPVNWYLRSLDMLNIQALTTPNQVKLLQFIWPYEDKPSDARRSLLRNFSIGQNTKGRIRQIDNRVMYPMNLVRDAIFVHLCHPRVFYTNYWIFGQSYNPYQTLRYAKINGRPSCVSAQSGGFFAFEYNGLDSPPCPTRNDDYIGKDALGVAAMVQAHERFAAFKDILDGTQRRESYPFDFQRKGEKPQKAIWKNDTGEFARAFKYNQPWLQVWQNPKTGRRVLLFQDNFAEAFEKVVFTVTINDQKIQRTAEGNQLYVEGLN